MDQQMMMWRVQKYTYEQKGLLKTSSMGQSGDGEGSDDGFKEEL